MADHVEYRHSHAVLCEHPLCAQGQRDGYHRRQPLRHSGHGQANADQEQAAQLFATQQAEDDDDGHDGDGHVAEYLAQVIEAALERGLVFLHALDQFGDVA